MSRDLTGGLGDAIAGAVVRPFMALRIDLADPVLAWTGIGTLVFDGRTWEGVGAVGSVSTVGEQTDGAAVGIVATLSGIPSEYRADIATQAQRGAVMEVWVGALDDTMTAMAVTPKRLWRGYVDQYQITDGGSDITVSVSGENSMRDQGRPRIKRYTDAEQRARYPGDKFFEYVPQMAELKILWARGDQSGTSSTSGGGGGGFNGGRNL